MDWFAYDDGNAAETHSRAPARPGFSSAENPHRHDGCERFCDHESQPGQRRPQAAVERALALGKDQGPLSRSQDTYQRLQSAAIVPFLIDRNDVQFRQEQPKKGPAKSVLRARK